MDASQELVVDQHEGLRILRLNRPERLNSFSTAILDGLAREVPKAVSDQSVRAIMLTGTGRAFSAGGDVSSMKGSGNGQDPLEGMRAYHPWVMALRTSEKPVIAAVNGVAAGGGFGLAMLADLVIASEAAWFKAAFSTLGAAADYGLAYTLPRVIGDARAADILLRDHRIEAREALAMGMVAEVLPADNFIDEAIAWASRIARLPRGAQLTMRLLKSQSSAGFAEYLEGEAVAQVEAFASQDFREGVTAFSEKREPRFTGC